MYKWSTSHLYLDNKTKTIARVAQKECYSNERHFSSSACASIVLLSPLMLAKCCPNYKNKKFNASISSLSGFREYPRGKNGGRKNCATDGP
ncbi:Proline-rich receptor-like protein kinase [Actinidia chinensis var. chinensis]|uniref:Proline-rich receptor-like protein kinase n=1 Tax=Actinidia chinensis var. chinensis TaxID=1590841 RepID=A0A2R6QH22_ACTCC|nr:Proline-rich receptor-like protein kinase [Actinidia chinensis var. chinensis]